MDIFARDYGIIPNRSVGKNFVDMMSSLRDIDGEKNIVFDEGVYTISSDDIDARKMYITNTIGDNEWKSHEDRHMRKSAITIDGLDNVTFKGNNSTFLLDGVMNNMSIIDSNNITLEDITFDTISPNFHEIYITHVSPFYFDFQLDKSSKYIKEKGKFYFVGKDYKLGFFDSRACCWWVGLVKDESIDNVKRVGHPLNFVLKLKELGDGKFRAYALLKDKIRAGNHYYVYDVRRKNVGIFMERSKNITLNRVTSLFNYSLGVVAQDSENITLNNVKMIPSDGKLLSSTADFVHLCMCRGDINVVSSTFVGAEDDCLNVHGIHFRIKSIDGDKIVVKFMHPQAFGFNPLRVNDVIEFVDRESLLAKGRATILASKLISEYEIELTLDSTKDASCAYVIEDITACPNLNFSDNYLNRIITRGILVTTRGKVVIKNNVFNSNTMHGILFSDDANSWYESGRVQDVLIEGNTFNYCPMYDIYIKPENRVHEGSVHGDFVIRNNTFNSDGTGEIYAKSTRSITLENNKSKRELKVDIENVEKVIR